MLSSSGVIFMAIIICLAIAVFFSEYRAHKMSKEIAHLAGDNMKLIGHLERTTIAGEELIIAYKAMYRIAGLKFTKEEIDELYEEKRVDIEIEREKQREENEYNDNQ